jgi:tetratricopeptide (TPR) repeat protein
LKRLVLTILSIATFAGPALGQIRHDYSLCVHGSRDPDDWQIRTCTRVIDSGLLSKSEQVMALVARSALYFRGQQRNLASQDIERAIALEPTNGFAFANRGSMRMLSGDTVGALRDFNEADRLIPNNAEILMSRGTAYAMTGTYDLALQDLRRAIELNPRIPAAHRHLGQVFLEQNQLERALQEMETAVRLEPGSAFSLLGRSRARRALGDIAGADADLAAARKIDPKIAR